MRAGVWSGGSRLLVLARTVLRLYLPMSMHLPMSRQVHQQCPLVVRRKESLMICMRRRVPDNNVIVVRSIELHAARQNPATT